MSAKPAEFPRAVPVALSLRAMQVDDVPAIMAIETRAYEFPWTESNFADSLHAGYIGLVAVDGTGTLLGYAVLMSAVDDLHILNLCVAPWVQGRGLGQRLLREIAQTASARGMPSVLLEVRPSNTHAIRLYERFGFAEIGRRKQYYPARDRGREDAIVMRLKIKPGVRHGAN